MYARDLNERIACELVQQRELKGKDSLLTGAVHLYGFLTAKPLENIVKVFESFTRSAKALLSGTK